MGLGAISFSPSSAWFELWNLASGRRTSYLDSQPAVNPDTVNEKGVGSGSSRWGLS